MSMKITFKPGDRVRFKSWVEMKEVYGTDQFDCINCLGHFTPAMAGLCGTTATIKAINCNGVVLLKDMTWPGPKNWVYSVDMFKPVDKEEIKEGSIALESLENYFLENFLDTDTVTVRSIIDVINDFKSDFTMEIDVVEKKNEKRTT